jgi:hypothetical protein
LWHPLDASRSFVDSMRSEISVSSHSVSSPIRPAARSQQFITVRSFVNFSNCLFDTSMCCFRSANCVINFILKLFLVHVLSSISFPIL